MSRRLACTVPNQGSGRRILARRRRPVTPNRSDRRTLVAEGQQGGVNPALQGDAVADQVETPPGALALGAMLRGGQPDRRRQVAAAQFGEHPGIDLFVLQASGARPFTRTASATSTRHPRQLQLASWT